MKTINPHYALARRRAEHNAARFGHPHLQYPAIARRGKPLPTDLFEPVIQHREPLRPIPGWNWDTAVLATCAAAMVTLLFIRV